MMAVQRAAEHPVLVMAGGTGGHVFPALAVARELMARGVPVVWMGTREGLEATVVPAAGIPIEWISVSGLRGKSMSRRLLAPVMLIKAGWQALRIVVRLQPRAVLGMGGFVTGPGGVASRLLGRPLCIHEQNAVAGLTNRMLSRIATHVLQAFPESFPADRATTVGNPVRREITMVPEPERRFAGREGRLRLLVLGGSLGAQALNQMMPQALALLSTEERPEVRHQAGTRNLEDARAGYAAVGLTEAEVRLDAFVEDMAEAYAWADLVVCRAGALTVSELTAVGIGAILVPFPHAVDDHQTQNAGFLADGGAALLVSQSQLTAERLAGLLRDFASDRQRLLEMATAARRLALPDATRRVADACLEIAKCQHKESVCL